VLLLAGRALAFEVKRSEEGTPLRWTPGTVEYHLDPLGGFPVPAGKLASILDEVFGTWAALPYLPLTLVRSEDRPGGFGYEFGAKNANVVRSASESWDYDADALMLTFVHYRTSDGIILDADILINGVNYRWRDTAKADTEETSFDLHTCLLHEAGHFLGLGHSEDHPEAVMYPSTAPDEAKRELAEDDVHAIAFLYKEAAEETEDENGLPLGGCQAIGTPPSDHGATRTGVGLLALVSLLAACRRRAFATVMLIVTLASSTASATLLLYRPLPELARIADRVVRGHVVEVRSLRSGRIIVTDTVLHVDECIAGPCSTFVVLRQPGGEIGGVGLSIEGTLRARPGTELIVFLRRSQAGHDTLIGMELGAFRVKRPKGRPAVAVRSTKAALVSESGNLSAKHTPPRWDNGQAMAVPSFFREEVTLETLRHTVRQARQAPPPDRCVR